MCLAVCAKVKKIEKDFALVDFGGLLKNISLGILKDVRVGDYVLVHAGFAIGKVQQAQAQESREALKEFKRFIAQ